MRSDFDDFRAVFFDLAFSFATSYRNGDDFRSEKMAIEKYCATRYQGVRMSHSHRPIEVCTPDAVQGNTHEHTTATQDF